MAWEESKTRATTIIRLPDDSVEGVGVMNECHTCGELIVNQVVMLGTAVLDVCDDCFFEGVDDGPEEEDYDDDDWD